MKNRSGTISELPASLKAPELTTERAASNPLLPHTWSIVLAGGEVERLRVLTKRWLGKHRPKQYCAFVGNRSMLQHTLDRAVVLSGMDRTLLVVARQHGRLQSGKAGVVRRQSTAKGAPTSIGFGLTQSGNRLIIS